MQKSKNEFKSQFTPHVWLQREFLDKMITECRPRSLFSFSSSYLAEWRMGEWVFFIDVLVVYMCIVFLQRRYHVWVKTSFYSLSRDSLWALISSAIKPRTVESRQILMLPFMDVKNNNHCILGIAKIAKESHVAVHHLCLSFQLLVVILVQSNCLYDLR